MELRQYFAVVRKYLWLILLTTLLAAGSAFYISYTAPPVYRATTTLEIDLGADPLSDPYSISSARTIESVVRVFAARIQSPALLQEVQAYLGLQIDVEDMISVEQVGATQFMRISAESSNPALAQALAETVARIFIEQEMGQQQARFQDGLAELEARIAALEAAIAETQTQILALGSPDVESEDLSEFARLELARLESQLTRDQTRLVVLLTSAEEFRLAMARYTDYITIFSPAELPATSVQTAAVRNTLLGAAAGLVVGIATAFLLEYLDDTIKSPEDVKQNLEVGVLGALPRLKSMDGHTALVVAEHPLQPVAEAFRNLRTSIDFSSLDRPARTLLVTSPLPTEGKTFTAANLAVVLAQSGKSVVLVDTDLRRPMVHRLAGLSKEPGLTTALLSPDQRPYVLRPTGIDGLQVVTSGSRAPNPAELLASHRFQEFVSWLTGEVDIVVFDSPPVLAVTDAAVLANLVDGTLLVVDCGETRRPAAIQAVERLTSVGGTVLGVVLNRLSASRNGHYYYYYYYYYGDGDHSGKRRGRSRWINRLLGRGRGRRRRRRSEDGATGRQGDKGTRELEEESREAEVTQ
jgi:capsular exopolysaccharide synthesis family protein